MVVRFVVRLIAGLSLVLPLGAAENGALPASPPDRVLRSWRTEDGLPQDSVNAIVQSRDGFLWIGTSAGLARFDGLRFRKFGLYDGLRSVRITALAEDGEGGLWIGTSGSGVTRWRAGRFTNFSAKEGWPAATEVITLAADRDGSMWIGTDKGLVQWRDGAFKTFGEEEGLPQKHVRAVLRDSKGTLWVSVLLEGLFRSSGVKFTRISGPGPTPASAYSLLESSDGAIWAGSDELWKWSGEAWQKFDKANGLPETPLQCLSQSADGTIWIGTRTHGMYRSVAERFECVAAEGPLSAQSVGAVIADDEGSVWAGAVSGGLHRLSPRLLNFWGANAGLPSTPITSVVEEASHGLLVGTANSGMHQLERGRFTPLVAPGGAPSKVIYCTTATTDGAAWAAGEQCLFRFEPGQPTKSFDDPLVRAEAIRAICSDGDSVWLGTYYSTLLKCDKNGLQLIAPAGTFPGTITSIVREAADRLWIGTSAGLHLWTRGEVRSWTTRDGLVCDNIRTLYRDPDGTMWLGTLGGGLTRYKDGQFVHFTSRDGLIDDVVSQILPDDFGALWLGCNRGLMRLDRRELADFADGKVSELHPITLGRNEGMLKEQCFGGTSPTACRTADGRLFFPTMDGLAEIDPRRFENLTTLSPKPLIEEILVDHRQHASDAALVIPPGAHQLELAFTAPLLRGGQWLRFRHRLEGFDRDWVSDGGSRRASYDGLSPGSYRFQVGASNGTGKWSTPGASLAFTVEPFLWQTLWFRIASLIVIVGISSAGAWWHFRRKHVRQLAELERQRKQQAELAHADRVALLGELSASLAHELKQPLAAILSNAQAAIRFLNSEPAEVSEVLEILKDIAESDRRATEIIARMRDMMKKGETRMEPCDLNTDVHQVLVLLRGELASRNVLVDTRLAPDLPLVLGDHVQLQQVLLNLVVNGCDAMHANAEGDRLLVLETSLDGDRHARISVTDRGSGIAPDVLGRVFEPFYSTKDTGFGMGLAICQAIIKAHGGSLWATNNPDCGATFHFTLTLEMPGQKGASAQASSVAGVN